MECERVLKTRFWNVWIKRTYKKRTIHVFKFSLSKQIQILLRKIQSSIQVRSMEIYCSDTKNGTAVTIGALSFFVTKTNWLDFLTMPVLDMKSKYWLNSKQRLIYQQASGYNLFQPFNNQSKYRFILVEWNNAIIFSI